MNESSHRIRAGKRTFPCALCCFAGTLWAGTFFPSTLRSAPQEVSLIIRPTMVEYTYVPQFGDSLAMQDRLVAVGDTVWSGGVEGLPSTGKTGAVHLYDLSNIASPTRVARVTGFDSGAESRFGTSVAISGNYLLVGAPKQEAIGAAYLFDISDPANPVEKAKIVASDRASNSDFGISVAIDGNYALIGTPSTGGTSGAAYLFDISTPTSPVEKKKLTAQSPQNGDLFGISVAVNAATNRVLIGATYPGSPGFAELYSIATPTAPSFLTALNATADESNSNGFGFAVDLSATAALVGAPQRDDMGVGNDTGAAYLFDLSSPTSPSGVQIVASDRGANHQFGRALKMDGNNAAIGARGTLSGLDGVFGYHFDISNLASPSQQGKLLPGNLRLFYQSMGIAIDKNLAVLSPVNDTDDSRTPAASVFKLFDAEIDLFPEEPVSGIPMMVYPGDSFSVNCDVTNMGNIDPSSFVVGVHLSGDNVVTHRDSQVGSLSLDTLAPGTTDSISIPVTIPDGFRLGYYYVGIYADASREITETDETNNTWVSTELLQIGTDEAIAKQGEIDAVDAQIAALDRKIKKLNRRAVKARKLGKRDLFKRLKKKIRKLKAKQRALLTKRSHLASELEALLVP